MKTIILSFLILFSINVFGQKWAKIYIVMDSSGKEVARKDMNTGEIRILNDSVAVSEMFKSMEYLKSKLDKTQSKYDILYQMILLVNSNNGCVGEGNRKEWGRLLENFKKL